jgi:hypothetical protein
VGWVGVGELGFVGLVMVGAFLRKAGRGVHLLRERRGSRLLDNKP